MNVDVLALERTPVLFEEYPLVSHVLVDEEHAKPIEVLIDGTKTPPIVRRRWDLTNLGPGYKPEVLGATADDGK